MQKQPRLFGKLTILLALALSGCEADQRGDLDETTFLALNIGIISTLTSSAAIHPVHLSDTLIERSADYESLEFQGDVLDAEIKPALLGGEMSGVLIDAQDKGMLISKLRGRVSTTIYVSSGKFGIVDGDLYFSQGTKIDTDGDDYIFQNDRWRIRPPPVTVRAVVVAIDPTKVESFALKPETLTGVLDTARNIFSSAEPEAWKSLVQEAIDLEVATRNDNSLLLGDIAKVELRNVELSETGDESTVILLRAEYLR